MKRPTQILLLLALAVFAQADSPAWLTALRNARPLDFYLRWEKPELNNFMRAPLAKKAGGTEACGRAVFKDTSDPDYQLLLTAFTDIHERVARVPRMDMPGAKEIRTEAHSPLYECLEKP